MYLCGYVFLKKPEVYYFELMQSSPSETIAKDQYFIWDIKRSKNALNCALEIKAVQLAGRWLRMLQQVRAG